MACESCTDYVIVPKETLIDLTQNITDLQVDVDQIKIDIAELQGHEDNVGSTIFTTIADLQEFGNDSPLVYITDIGKEGFFRSDLTDTTTSNNGGTVLVINNIRYKRILSNYVNVKWFGAIGDGIVDDTSAIQNAFDQCTLLRQIAYFPEGNYKTTSAIVIGCNIQMSFYATLKPTGTNYTAFTTKPDTAFDKFSIKINGGGNTLNGLKVDKAVISNFQYIRVENCNGKGFEISRTYDSVFQTISVELSGNSNNYAFSITDGGDTTNMTHILRLQVEQSLEKAIYISPNSLNLTVENIHSERAMVSTVITDTWFLGGATCTYDNVRVNAITNDTYSDLFARCHIYGAQITVNELRAENNVPVVVESWAEGLANVTLNNVNVSGVFSKSNNGDVFVYGGYIQKVTGVSNRLWLCNLIIDTLDVGSSPNESFPVNVINSRIKHLTSNSVNSYGVFTNSTIDDGAFLQGSTKLVDSQFTCGNATVNYRRIILNNSLLIGNLTTDTVYLELSNNTKIRGNLVIGTNRQVIIDSTCCITGTLTNMGPPESHLYYNESDWETGKTTVNPKTRQIWRYLAGAWSLESTFSSNWNGNNPFMLGGYQFWVDSTGKLRTKNGNAASDTDGILVGITN